MHGIFPSRGKLYTSFAQWRERYTGTRKSNRIHLPGIGGCMRYIFYTKKKKCMLQQWDPGVIAVVFHRKLVLTNIPVPDNS